MVPPPFSILLTPQLTIAALLVFFLCAEHRLASTQTRWMERRVRFEILETLFSLVRTCFLKKFLCDSFLAITIEASTETAETDATLSSSIDFQLNERNV